MGIFAGDNAEAAEVPAAAELNVATIDEDDRPKKKQVHEMGQGLALLSVQELHERVASLREEIARLEAAAGEKAGLALRRGYVFQKMTERPTRLPPPFSTDRNGVYSLVSFLVHYLIVHSVDTEWLLSTLFDASLLSLEPPATAALFTLIRNAQRAARRGNHVLTNS